MQRCCKIVFEIRLSAEKKRILSVVKNELKFKMLFIGNSNSRKTFKEDRRTSPDTHDNFYVLHNINQRVVSQK